jgi:hypothetical protein
MTDAMKIALKVKRKNEKKWLRLKGVVAVGIGKVGDNIGIIISVENESDIPHIKIPALVDHVPVKIQSVGKIEAL